MDIQKINWAGIMVEDFEVAVQFFNSILELRLENIYKDKQVAQFRIPSGQLFEVFGPRNKERKEKYKLGYIAVKERNVRLKDGISDCIFKQIN